MYRAALWSSTDGTEWTRVALSRTTAGTDVSLLTLKQSGSVPWPDSWQIALGPTGLLVTDDGSRFWIGFLEAG
jgi:hypothetical protein